VNILCVDDDPVVLELLRRTVEKMELPDCTLRTTMSGKEAIELVMQQQTDLVILDYKLPDLSGREVLAAIRKLRPRTEVLIVTGYSSVETAVEAMKAGARDFIEKPFKVTLLHEKLRNIFELQEREHEAEEFRFAKEMVEAGASRDISALECVIAAMTSCRERVMTVLDSTESDAEKLTRIRRELETFCKGCV
jgi:DNA-binding NtrC family response regulator